MRYVHNKPVRTFPSTNKPTVRTFPSTDKPTVRLADNKPVSKPTNTQEVEDLYNEIDGIERQINKYIADGEEENQQMIDSLEGYLDYLYDMVDDLTNNDNSNNDLSK